MLLPYMWQKQMFPSNTKKCHIWLSFHMQITNSYITIYTSHALITINSVTTNTAIHTFILLAYVPQQICLLHCMYMVYCTSTAVCIQTHTTLHISKNNKLQPFFTIYIHIYANNKYSLKCHIYITYANNFICKYETAMLVYISYELTPMNIVIRSTGIYAFHITGIYPLGKHATLHKYVLLHFYSSLHIDPYIIAHFCTPRGTVKSS